MALPPLITRLAQMALEAAARSGGRAAARVAGRTLPQVKPLKKPARNQGKIAADLRKAADRIEKQAWKKPVVLERVRTARDAPAPKGFSIQRMMRAAPESVVAAARKGDVHVIRAWKKVQRGQLVRFFMTSTSENGQARQHVQIIKVKDKVPTLHQSKDLYYECDCGYWKFYCDYAAWKAGASELKHSTNEPPVEKNPSMKVYPCKHILTCCEVILEERL